MTTSVVTVAFAVGYLGDSFHGSQVQPDVRTVQGDLEAALAARGITATETARIRMSSRTDAGVHARMNVGCCELPASVWADIEEGGFIRVMNDGLDESVVWAAMEVEPGWNPRPALRRTYRYRLEALRGWDSKRSEEELDSVLSLFIGEHDFTAFARIEEGRSPVRCVESCQSWSEAGRLVGFEIAAESFLWNQVRRISWAVVRVLAGDLSAAAVSEALAAGEARTDLGVAAARWLTLWSIDHAELAFDSDAVDAGDQLSAPPGDAEEREHRMWQATAEMEQKLLLRRCWMQALSTRR
jgi:tRNA pseudouridine38-40 synthase